MARQTRASRREYWRQVVHRQKASGLSIQGFCRGERLAMATFYAWKRRLGQEPHGPQESKRPAIGFAPVRIVAEPGGSASAGTIEIVLGRDRRIRLAGPVDKKTLADVLAVLEGPAC
jgi:hypothetical protein